MDPFEVLAEPRRRRVVELLAHKGRLNASQISDEFDVTPQAMSQHLKVLREAKVIRMEKSAQRRFYSLNPESMSQIEEWAVQMAKLWIGRLNRIERALEEEAA